MEKTYRYVVNAVGKGGETYYTQLTDKQDLKKWIKAHQDKLLMDDLKVDLQLFSICLGICTRTKNLHPFPLAWRNFGGIRMLPS